MGAIKQLITAPFQTGTKSNGQFGMIASFQMKPNCREKPNTLN